MFLEESRWIAKKVGEKELPKRVLDVGSGDLDYREKKQSEMFE